MGKKLNLGNNKTDFINPEARYIFAAQFKIFYTLSSPEHMVMIKL